MKKFLTIILVSLLPLSILAQNVLTVRGTVKDANSEPVIGALVTISSDNSVGIITDLDGKFEMKVPSAVIATAVLKVSCMSYKTEEVKIAGRTNIDVTLKDDTQLLNEVVVVGYGSMRRSDLTGSVASVKLDESVTSKSSSIDQLIQGRASGVEVISSSEAPDAGVNIRIRGITSLNGSSEPLYVIDGVILTTAGAGSIGSDAAEEVNGLMGLNPQDIASIEILKDASATAIYGAAGANGVVLITTKEASREKPVISFSAGVDFNTPYKYIDVADFDQFLDYVNWRKDAGDSFAVTTLGYIYKDYGKPTQQINVKTKDWQREYIRNTFNQRYYLSISGKPKSFSYLLSVGYNKTNGIVVNTGSEQFTSRINLTKNIGSRFTLGIKSNFAYIKSTQMQGAGSGDNSSSTSFMKALVNYRPFVNFVATGEEEDEYEETDDEYSLSSPGKWVKDSYSGRVAFRATPSIFGNLKITDWLSFKTTFGADYHRQEMSKFKGVTVSKSPAQAGVTYGETYSWNWDNVFLADKSFGDHSINGTVGFTMNKYDNTVHTSYATDIVQYGTGVDNINSGNVTTLTYGNTTKTKMSGFARAIYNYANRYVVTATYRLDGSSLFAANNRFASFPSVAAAWKINKEPWFNVPLISMLKLRAGWGLVGNCSLSPYQTMSTYSSGKIGYHFNEAQYQTTIKPGVFANPDLKWETTNQWNAGLDFEMWQGLFVLSVDAYYKNTYDLLQSRKVSYNTGYSSIWVNQGSILNKGVEVSLEATPFAGKNFEWTISGNISLNRGTLTDIGFDAEESVFYFEPGVPTKQIYYTGGSVAGTQSLGGAPINIYMLGQPIGLFYGYKTDGLVKEGSYGIPVSKENYESRVYSKPGSINYVDMNGNGYLDIEDKTVIGNANPKFTYGFSTSFTIYKFRIQADFNGSFGGQIYNANLMSLINTHYQGSVKNILSTAYSDAWTVINPHSAYVATKDAAYYNQTFTDVFTNLELPYATDRDVEDASYLRLSNLSVSYTFQLPKKSVLKKINVGLSSKNLLMLTRYSGYSPIVNSYSITSQRIGVDSGGYPTTRSFCFDVKLTF